MNKKNPKSSDSLDQIQNIKRLAIIAMFSDDLLMELFVLKGGNAIDLAYNAGSRASIDIDLSMETKFKPDEIEEIKDALKRESRTHSAQPVTMYLTSRSMPFLITSAQIWRISGAVIV